MPIFTDDHETKITLESGGNALPEDMPFRLLLLGDWSGRASHSYSIGSDLRDRRPFAIDRDNFEDVMRKLQVELTLDLPGDSLRIRFEELDDFHPDKIFHQVPLFADLRDTRKRLMNPQTFNSAAREVREWLGQGGSSDGANNESVTEASSQPVSQPTSGESLDLLDQILSQSGESPVNRKPVQTAASKELNVLLGNLVRPFLVHTDEAEQSKLVDAVDQASGELMRKILHHPLFQALEAAWRGVYFLISKVETDTDLKIYLLDAAKEEIKNDLKSVGNLSESGFYKLLMEKTPGNHGDESWAAVFGDYNFSPNVEDAAALMRIAQIAAASEAPFVAQANPKILGIESLAETPDADDWKTSENSPEAKLWAMLREMPESAYLGLMIPRVIARMPYGARSEPTENFAFEELDSSPDHNHYLWANGIFACALVLAQSFREANGWEMERLVQDIDDVPMHMYKENGETKIKPGAEIVMTQKAAEKIIGYGLMPLISFRDSNRIRLARLQSVSASSESLRGKWS